MKNYEKGQERKVYVTIRSGRKTEKLETWRYWEIVGALQWMGADRETAYKTALRCARARGKHAKWLLPTGIIVEIFEEGNNAEKSEAEPEKNPTDAG